MACITSYLGIFAWLRVAQAAPTQNLTALRTDIAPSWVSDPDDRGTWSLLYSCVFTLTLCVWSAVHPNVPSRAFQQSVAKHGSKIFFVLAAILAPELGVFVAFRQFQRARSLIKELSRLRTQGGSGSLSIPKSAGVDGLVSH